MSDLDPAHVVLAPATVALASGIISEDFYGTLVLPVIVSSQAAGAWLGRVLRAGRPLRISDAQASLV